MRPREPPSFMIPPFLCPGRWRSEFVQSILQRGDEARFLTGFLVLSRVFLSLSRDPVTPELVYRGGGVVNFLLGVVRMARASMILWVMSAILALRFSNSGPGSGSRLTLSHSSIGRSGSFGLESSGPGLMPISASGPMLCPVTSQSGELPLAHAASAGCRAAIKSKLANIALNANTGDFLRMTHPLLGNLRFPG